MTVLWLTLHLTLKMSLKEHGLELNIPPFWKDKPGFDWYDVIKTQTIAQHIIHVEREIGKVKRLRIFHSVIPVAIFGSVNQNGL